MYLLSKRAITIFVIYPLKINQSLRKGKHVQMIEWVWAVNSIKTQLLVKIQQLTRKYPQNYTSCQENVEKLKIKCPKRKL